ncbi:hypothetical protein RB195_001928 [Necator americanus]|uniref:Fucosyltransferase n=1 Tax=Necator americanus TaxID=51031 RepID=A0ABR1DGL4_NECAM
MSYHFGIVLRFVRSRKKTAKQNYMIQCLQRCYSLRNRTHERTYVFIHLAIQLTLFKEKESQKAISLTFAGGEKLSKTCTRKTRIIPLIVDRLLHGASYTVSRYEMKTTTFMEKQPFRFEFGHKRVSCVHRRERERVHIYVNCLWMVLHAYEKVVMQKGQHRSALKYSATAIFLLAAFSTVFLFYQDTQGVIYASQAIPLIVAWTNYFSSNLKVPLLETLANCTYQCEFINREEHKLYDRSASAYVLHGRDLNISDLPKRSYHHLHVLFLLESPYHTGSGIHRVPPDFFNATITYRRDSRYFYPYGHFDPLISKNHSSDIVTEEQLTAAVRKKHRGSLIFVSNCHTPSKRENLIRELRKFTEITVRGGCRKELENENEEFAPSCEPPTCNESDDHLIETHRFYISFENSICNDYITEKFFSRVSQLLVPVVVKRHIYEGAGIPRHAFIAVDDFASIKELGDYLNFLRANDAEYMKYFEWTASFRKPTTYRSNALCKLCEDIYNGERLVIKDIAKYYDENQCI